MSGRFLIALASALSLVAAQGALPARAQDLDGSIKKLGDFVLSQYELTPMWDVQVQVGVQRGGLAYMVGYVSPTRSTTLYHVAEGKQYLATYSEFERDAFGTIIGPEGAKTRAEKELARLQAEKPELKAEVQKHVVPQITLYCMSSSGLVQAVDAESGKTLWIRQFGSPDHPALSPGVNDTYVAIVNGSTVYVADSQTGDVLFEQKLHGVPGAGPAISNDVVHVPMLSGFMESYYFADEDGEDKREPYSFRSIGACTVQPIVWGGEMAWATTRGYLYVGEVNQNNVRYRLECRDAIPAKPAFASGSRIIVVSVDGNAYCLKERSGALAWRFTTGEPIVESPLAIENDVFIANQYGGLFCVSLEDGQERWWAPSVTRIVGASATRVYGLDVLGRMHIVDRATGGLIGTLPFMHAGIAYVNAQTDRLYLATDRGRVVAIRETGAEYPALHDLDAPPTAPPAQGGATPQAPATQQKSADPFAAPGAAADPFADPGADPFGTTPPAGGMPAPAGAADPFADPFAAPPAGGADPKPAEGAADPFADPFAN